GERGELVVVGGLAGDGLGEDGRVRRHAADALVDARRERAVLEVRPLEVVQPGALALLLVQLVQLGHEASLSTPRRARAAAATLSAVKPNSSRTLVPSADAPKWSIDTDASAHCAHPNDAAASTASVGTSGGSTRSR